MRKAVKSALMLVVAVALAATMVTAVSAESVPLEDLNSGIVVRGTFFEVEPVYYDGQLVNRPGWWISLEADEGSTGVRNGTMYRVDVKWKTHGADNSYGNRAAFVVTDEGAAHSFIGGMKPVDGKLVSVVRL